MLRSLFVVCALAVIPFCFSKPVSLRRWDDLQVKHAWVEVPRGWELHGPAPANYRFDLRIGLKQARFDELVTALYEVSDPTHEKLVFFIFIF